MKKQHHTLKKYIEKDTKEANPLKVEATLEVLQQKIKLNFQVIGNRKAYVINSKLENEEKIERKDELWKSTCFELFIANSPSEEYYEINISPFGEWNIYHLNAYKVGFKEFREVSKPIIKMTKENYKYRLSFEIEFNQRIFNNEGLSFNLATIILDKNNLRHFYSICPRKTADFHNRISWNTKN